MGENSYKIIRYIWGDAAFPRTKPASIEKNAPSPVKDLKNSAGVETFTIRMEADQENTTHPTAIRVVHLDVFHRFRSILASFCRTIWLLMKPNPGCSLFWCPRRRPLVWEAHM